MNQAIGCLQFNFELDHALYSKIQHEEPFDFPLLNGQYVFTATSWRRLGATFCISFPSQCCFTCATRRRLGTTLSASDKRKALRRCPDLSRKRDGIAVRAFSSLLSAAQNCEPILYSEAQRLGGRIGFYDTPAANAASPGRGVMPTRALATASRLDLRSRPT